MNKLVNWWKRKGWAPPHVIAWKVLWVGPVYLTIGLAFVTIAIGFGWSSAKYFWESVT